MHVNVICFLYNSERTFARKKKNNGISSDFFAMTNWLLVYSDNFSCGDFQRKSWLSPLDQCHRRKRHTRPIFFFGVIEKMKDLCTFQGRKINYFEMHIFLVGAEMLLCMPMEILIEGPNLNKGVMIKESISQISRNTLSHLLVHNKYQTVGSRTGTSFEFSFVASTLRRSII